MTGAAFAFEREQIIPEMFRSLLERVGIVESQAPTFDSRENRAVKGAGLVVKSACCFDEDCHGRRGGSSPR